MSQTWLGHSPTRWPVLRPEWWTVSGLRQSSLPAMCSPSRNERDHDVGVPIEVLTPAVVGGRGARISIPRDDLGVSGPQSPGCHLGGLEGPGSGSMVERLRGGRRAGPAGRRGGRRAGPAGRRVRIPAGRCSGKGNLDSGHGESAIIHGGTSLTARSRAGGSRSCFDWTRRRASRAAVAYPLE
jgi:hypothetical protein